MSKDDRTVENLTALYMSQSPAAFLSVAMSAHGAEPADYSKREDEEIHGGDSKCDYPCCNDKGCCSSPGWYLCPCGCVAGLLACCCYITDGFNGAWTYWPF
ncbi:MAG: hypothetical protein LBG62_06210 [Candidatus Methanoplasma sp.]|jgi:hypothetical protein|nr:hypothetical protein [Candidatus Methanoplasma sp.]